MNRRPEFDGVEFDDKFDDKGNLASITCRMFIKGRERPVCVTEYMSECKDPKSSVWTKWPARMLRYKVYIQCARMAFGITEIIDDDNFLIDTGVNASSAATGGGSGGSYTANMLILSTPAVWGMWDGKIKFDSALDIDRTMALAFYKSPALLSPSNQSNFLTNRYPRLLRTACQAMSADFMKDSDEYTKSLTALTALVQSTAAEDDLSYRGAIFGTGTP